MGKSLFALLILTIAFFSCFAQKVKKEKIEIKYIKLPLAPLPSDIKTYSTKTECLLGAYQGDGTVVFKVGTVESTGKEFNGNPEVKFKDKTKEYEDKYLKLDGYQKTSGISDLSIIIKFGLLTVLRQGEPKSYFNSNKNRCSDQPYTYSLPCTLLVKTNKGVEILNNTISSGTTKSTTSNTLCYGKGEQIGDTGVEFKLFEFLSNQYYKSAKNIIENSISITTFSDDMPVFYIKPKDYDYSDLNKAMNDFKNSVNLMNTNSDDENAKKGLRAAIEIWAKAIQEVDYTNKKARINKEIACALNYNCAFAYWRLNEFENARKTIVEAKNDFEKEASELESIIVDSEKRFNASLKN